jgi:hypothetical protein
MKLRHAAVWDRKAVFWTWALTLVGGALLWWVLPMPPSRFFVPAVLITVAIGSIGTIVGIVGYFRRRRLSN